MRMHSSTPRSNCTTRRTALRYCTPHGRSPARTPLRMLSCLAACSPTVERLAGLELLLATVARDCFSLLLLVAVSRVARRLSPSRGLSSSCYEFHFPAHCVAHPRATAGARHALAAFLVSLVPLLFESLWAALAPRSVQKCLCAAPPWRPCLRRLAMLWCFSVIFFFCSCPCTPGCCLEPTPSLLSGDGSNLSSPGILPCSASFLRACLCRPS